MLPLRPSEPSMVPPETRQHSEYRTRLLVIEAWDQMEANCEFMAMGM